MSCEEIIGNLPFFLNGSLEKAERSKILDHLVGCSRCAEALEETAAAWSLFAQHTPSFELAAHALGIQLGDSVADRIEAHLAVCDSCRTEFETVRSENVVDFPTPHPALVLPSMPTPHVGWRLLAAAGLVALVGSAWLLRERPTFEEFPTLGMEANQTESRSARSGDTEVARGGDEVLDMALFANGFEEGDIDSWPEVGELR